MSRLTLTDLLNAASPATRKLNPELFNGTKQLTLPVEAGNPRSTPKLERRTRSRALAKDENEKGDSRVFFVRVVSYRCRLLDEDNLCEKFHVDLLRYAGILPSDAPSQARIVTTQEKVSRKEDQRTEIEISILP